MYHCGEDWMQEAKRSEEDADAIDRQGAGEVRHDNPSAAASYPEHLDEPHQIVTQQYDRCTFASDVGPGTHGDSYVGFHEGRRVVHTIAHHCDNFTCSPKGTHAGDLLVRQQLRIDFVNSQFGGRGLCDLLSVTGKENGSYAEIFQFGHGGDCFGPKHVGYPD